MVDWIIRNALVMDQGKLQDLAIEGKHIFAVGDHLSIPAERELDVKGRVVVPGFVDPHVHLDIAMMNDWITPGRPKDFLSPVELTDEVERRRKAFTREEIEQRAGFAVELAVRHGVSALRAQCHVDLTIGLKHLEALLAVKEKYQDKLDLQIVTFPQQGLLSTPGTIDLFEEAFRIGADVMGCASNLDASGPGSQGFKKHIDAAFDLAMKLDLPLDAHADIYLMDDPQLSELEIVYLAQKTIETGYQGRVAAGHVSALDSARPEIAQAAIEWMRKAQIHVISQPDLYRLGRMDERHVRRGMTRVKQLLAAGVNVTFASNNVRDAYRPLGNLNPIEEGLILSYGAHMDTTRDLENILRMCTYNGAKALQLADYGLQTGCRADLVVIDAFSQAAVIANQAEKLYVFKAGRLAAENPMGNSRYYLSKPEPAGSHSPWQGEAPTFKTKNNE